MFTLTLCRSILSDSSSFSAFTIVLIKSCNLLFETEISLLIFTIFYTFFSDFFSDNFFKKKHVLLGHKVTRYFCCTHPLQKLVIEFKSYCYQNTKLSGLIQFTHNHFLPFFPSFLAFLHIFHITTWFTTHISFTNHFIDIAIPLHPVFIKDIIC